VLAVQWHPERSINGTHLRERFRSARQSGRFRGVAGRRADAGAISSMPSAPGLLLCGCRPLQ
jgi:hypothetical protein